MAARHENLIAQVHRERFADTPDAALLEQFARSRDGDAFAAIVGRHGPMVFGVCQRILRHHPDAEDAVQAVFFVLARHANRLTGVENLGGWLNTVAVNMALKSRREASRRIAREARVARLGKTNDHQTPEQPAGVPELSAVIDEEIARLPVAHREAIVLCDLQSHTQEAAAELLGRPRGTVAVHLARGRDKLRKRLESRGITLTVAAITTVAFPERLLSSCLEAAISGTTSTTVRDLAAGYRTGVLTMKLKCGLAVLVVLVAGIGISVFWDRDRPNEGSRIVAAPAPVTTATTGGFLFAETVMKPPGPKDPAPGFGQFNVSHIEWWIGDANGKNLRKLNEAKSGRVRARPIDQTVVLKKDENELTLLGPDGADLVLSLKDGPLGKTPLSDQFTTVFAFTPDGKYLVYSDAKGDVCRIQLATKELSKLAVTGVDCSEGIHFSHDGSQMVYSKYFRANDFVSPVFSVYVANADGTGEKKLTAYEDGQQLGFEFLPDGRVGLVGPKAIRAFDPKSDKVETIASWDKALQYRRFGGFNPEGTSFLFDIGGPYQVTVLSFDIKTKKVTPIKRDFHGYVQGMIRVRVPVEKK